MRMTPGRLKKECCGTRGTNYSQGRPAHIIYSSRFIYRWKERVFILTRYYFQCFKKDSKDLTGISLLEKRGYLTICLIHVKMGKLYLRKNDGIREWFKVLKVIYLLNYQNMLSLLGHHSSSCLVAFGDSGRPLVSLLRDFEPYQCKNSSNESIFRFSRQSIFFQTPNLIRLTNIWQKKTENAQRACKE